MVRGIGFAGCWMLMGMTAGWVSVARAEDCNSNGVDDQTDLAMATSLDCNSNTIPDECDIEGGTSFDDNLNGVPDECDPDCNTNGRPDFLDILLSLSTDCNTNAVPDECEPDEDCNANGTADICDLVGGTSADCNTNAIPDECELDCNTNGIPDDCDLATGTSGDCNTNSIPDECDPDCNGNLAPDDCDLAMGSSVDCNGNTTPDECDIAAGTSPDLNENDVPDECDPDCNSNGWPDFLEILFGFADDCNDNIIPDECEDQSDCQPNGTLDICDVAAGTSVDCNANTVPDECDILGGTSTDVNTDGVPDECDFDCNSNGIPDSLDIATSSSQDCNSNDVPDECDVVNCPPEDTTCVDCDSNGVPDGCQPDCNTNGVADPCDLAALNGYQPTLGTLPDGQGFELVHSLGNPSPDYELVGGALHQGPTAEGGYQYYKSSALRLDFGVGFELNVTLKVVSSEYNASCYGMSLGGYGLSATDDDLRVYYIWIASDRIMLHNSNTGSSTGVSYSVGEGYRDYRFVVRNSVGTLFVDDEEVLAEDIGPTGEASESFRNVVWFGDGTGCANSSSETFLSGLTYESTSDPSAGDSEDCNLNGTPDECEAATDCNTNGIADSCDVVQGTSQDCDTNGTPDECELGAIDCNSNAIPDRCELEGNDCNSNASPDDCETEDNDCNSNSVPDDCELVDNDCNSNSVPDDCEPDCNTNGVADGCDLSAGTSTDIDSNGIPDECGLDCNTNGIIDGCDISCAGGCAGEPECGGSLDCQGDGIPDECQADCNTNGMPDDCDIAAGTAADCDSSGVPDGCEIASGSSPDCQSNGVPDICDISEATSNDLNVDGTPDECEVVIRVDGNAASGGDGTSWLTAFDDLQDALALAASNGVPTQVWLAAGTYAPAGPGGSRTATFELTGQMGLYGGFAGLEMAFEERDPSVNVVRLSGDLDGDDQSGGNNSENSYHVLRGLSASSSVIVDGVIIVGGNADGSSPDDRGAGLYCSTSAPILRDCTVRGHSAEYGAVYLSEADATFKDCVFSSNGAGYGGALFSELRSYPVMTSCVYRGNTAGSGGAVYGSGLSTPVWVNSLFVGNAATEHGGAVLLNNSTASATNCSFSRNVAGGDGGGVYVWANGDLAARNCILWRNEDAGGLDSSAQIHVVSGEALVDHSCMQGGWSGEGMGNLSSDPVFRRDPSDGGDGWGVGGNDDYGDLRLRPVSACIDAGDNLADWDREKSGAQALPDADLMGQLRFYDDPLIPDTGEGDAPIVDLGAYEFQGDCNDNGVADELDVTGATSQDCNTDGVPDECGFDCNDNGLADECDLAEGTSDDCNTNGTPDLCDVLAGTAVDCDSNAVPDACQPDADTDGLIDPCDGCPGDSGKIAPGTCGCGVTEADGDGDSVPDCVDLCPDTPNGYPVDANGCVVGGACCFGLGDCFDGGTQVNCEAALGSFQGEGTTCVDDRDDDGTADCDEQCPDDPAKTDPEVCGCGAPEVADDADADGVWDCADLCPATEIADPVDSNGCSLYGACCFTGGACFERTLIEDCQIVGRWFQGNQSECAHGCAFSTAGDFDGDGNVDADDFAILNGCMSGPREGSGFVPPVPQCRAVFDFDDDDDVDLLDFADFAVVFSP
ncbi:MAG: hypothetical protein GY842_03350 [bacterium]|nr:hypothetical protein [bacterium]